METRYKRILLFLICISPIILTGCKGSAGKKAATEALEMLERKGATSVESTIEREATQVERASTKEAESYGSSRNRRYRPQHNSYDDDESVDEPQVYTVQCSQCSGSGVVYILDYYGNVQYDYYGNPLVSPCPSCGGSGSIIVSE